MSDSPARKPRRYKTHWTVSAADRVATASITIGGVGTILAVLGVCVFLVSVVVPLFMPGSAEPVASSKPDWPDRTPLHIGCDEYRTLGYALFDDGSVEAFRLSDGKAVTREHLTDRHIASIATNGDRVALGYGTGEFELVTIDFEVDFPDAASLGVNTGSISTDAVTIVDGAVVQRTPEGQMRRLRLGVEAGGPIAVEGANAISHIDFIANDSGSTVILLTDRGEFLLYRVAQTENLMTGEITMQTTSATLPKPESRGAPPQYIGISGSGNAAYALWKNGAFYRYDIRNIDDAGIAEKLVVVADKNDSITEFRMLLGRTTLLIGESDGTVRALFPYNSEELRTPDGIQMARAHTLKGPASPVTAIAPSPRSRMVAVGYENGIVRAFQVTSQAQLFEIDAGRGQPVEQLAIAPKGDGLIALGRGGLSHYHIDTGYPEATLSALFTPVWYEGYEHPEQVWQSSSGTDDFEPKFGLWPLVFGTLKATFYSMLFGVPLALLAALFSSEFLTPALRTRVKTLIEFMASLPSVVLGFLAALVFAPFVQAVVPTVMVGFVTVPGMFLFAAYLWQMLPQHRILRLERYRVLFLLVVLPIGMMLAIAFGPIVERLFFIGDLRQWLAGHGSGFGGWVMLLLPVGALVSALVIIRGGGEWMRRQAATSTRTRVAVLDLARFGVGVLGAVAVAFVCAWLLGQLGLDPRGPGGFFGTYVQRNALIVGFVMGFAVIPIIYTIAEDALSSVPEHLRAASLGAGATTWQTATRIVIPAAMSGLFSAIMIGLGRAVGETMIVLMAAGNTPVLEMNIFNGFRTLSANIAVELPEAVRNSTHYRTLFLAALLLFLMTFIVNTVAEIIRLRFRKKAHQL